MKLLISSDLHIHRKLRLEDTIQNLEMIENASTLCHYDSYVVTGDIFHSNRPTIEEITVFANHLRNIKADQILLVVGNHDEYAKDANSLNWTKIDPRIKLSDEFDVELEGNRCLFTHKVITESKFGPCNMSLPGVSVEDLKEYDVVVSGHIHRPQVLSKNPLVLIPGSLFKVNFGERDDEKYFYSLTLSENKPILLTQNLPTRNMLKIKYLVDEKKIFVNDKEVKKLSVKNAMIQLELVGKKESIRKLNYDKLIKVYADCFSIDVKITYVTPDKLKVENETQTNFELNTDSIKNKLARYCEFNKLGKRVRKMAENILTITKLDS